MSLAEATAVPAPAVDERTPGADRLGLVALGLLTLLTIGLAIAPVLLGAGERDVVGDTFVGPGANHLFGTDSQGRDMFARTILGARTSWFAAIAVVSVGATIGSVVGLIAGFTGGFIDTVLMRLTDAALALPGPLVALAVVSALGTGLRNTLIAVAATWWPWYARIVRGQVHALTHRAFVEAARLGGVGRIRRAVVHVLPGTVGPVIVAISLDLGAVILVLAGLSFLGLGSPPPAAELGAMSSQGLTFLFNAWWIAVIPAVAVFVLAMLANLAGDAVRDLAER